VRREIQREKSAADEVLPFSGDSGKLYKGVSAQLCDRKQLEKTERVLFSHRLVSIEASEAIRKD